MSVCKGCGKTIVFAKSLISGKQVPMDPAVQVYLVFNDGQEITCEPAKKGEFMVSHFVTCPDANKFSGRNA